MVRRLTSLGLFAAGLLAVLIAPLAGQRSSDRKYVEFCLAQMSPEMRREVAQMSCVLTPGEFDALIGLDYDGDRERWIRKYWKYRDPVFTTPENEVLEEHLRRAAYADSAFRIAKWPMWDQRGEVYIRYGEPTIRNIIRPDVDAKGETFPGELWIYAEHNMTVLFEDPFSRGVYRYYIERVQGPLSARMDNIAQPIDGPVTGMLSDLTEVPQTTLAMEKAYTEHLESICNFYETMAQRPSTYPYEFQRGQEPFVFSVDNFRGGAWIDRVDVNIEFEADLRPMFTGNASRAYTATAVFWDTKHDEVGRREQRFSVPSSGGAQKPIRLVPAQLVFSLPPGFYTMAVTVEERESGRVSSYRTDVTCVDFESKLAVSDILFASAIRPAERLTPFNRGALEVVPHPSRRYDKSEAVPIYFEVYNLARDKNDMSSYTVEYQVVPHVPREATTGSGDAGSAGEAAEKRGPGSPAGPASSFRMSGSGPYDVVSLLLDPGTFWVGDFDLHVTVTDDLARAEASRTAAFRIVE
jgi:GWxTD domain-containing protein